MNEQPHKNIMNREKAISDVKRLLPNQTELLRDITNYGSNLIVRAINSSPDKITSSIVCGVLLKQIVSMTDAAEVLISSGCVHAAFLPARAAFEASIYILWILKNNNQRRATLYLVSNYRDERVWIKRATPGSVESKDLQKISQPLGIDIHHNLPDLASHAKSQLISINKILDQPELKNIDEEFTKFKGKSKNEPKWYELEGFKSIRQLAIDVERQAQYEFFYSKGSQVTHIGSYKNHVHFSKCEIHLKPIRNLEDINILLNFLITSVIDAYENIITNYRPGEINSFTNKYLSDWSHAFINASNITITSNPEKKY